MSVNLVDRLRQASNDCSGNEPSLSVLQRAADEAATALEQALEALKQIKAMTDADDPESYRSDDREGCLETVFQTATDAIQSLLANHEDLK